MCVHSRQYQMEPDSVEVAGSFSSLTRRASRILCACESLEIRFVPSPRKWRVRSMRRASVSSFIDVFCIREDQIEGVTHRFQDHS